MHYCKLLFEKWVDFKRKFFKDRCFYQVDQMTFTNNCKPKCMLSFPSDRTIQTLQVILTGTEFGRNSPVLRKSIILENGIQQFLSGNDSFVYKSEVPAYIITVQNPQVICIFLSFLFCQTYLNSDKLFWNYVGRIMLKFIFGWHDGYI